MSCRLPCTNTFSLNSSVRSPLPSRPDAFSVERSCDLSLLYLTSWGAPTLVISFSFYKGLLLRWTGSTLRCIRLMPGECDTLSRALGIRTERLSEAGNLTDGKLMAELLRVIRVLSDMRKLPSFCSTRCDAWMGGCWRAGMMTLRGDSPFPACSPWK